MDSVETALRDKLAELLDRLGPAAKERMAEIFPHGVPRDKLESAIRLCDRSMPGGGA